MQQYQYDFLSERSATNWWYQARKQIIDVVMSKFLPFQRTQSEQCRPQDYSLIEIGCGSGENLDFLKKHGKVSGAEMDEAMLQQTRRRYPNIRILQHYVPQKLDQQFDTICMFDVLEHIEDDKNAVDWLHDHLTAKGRLVITVPAFMFLWGQLDRDSMHYRRYTLGQIKRLFEGQFRVVYASYFNFLLFPPILAVRIFERLTGRPGDSGRSMSTQGLTNQILYRIFVLEKFLLPILRFPLGVSIIAVLEKR